MKHGKFYKIGRSNSSGRRNYELKIQMPEQVSLIHEIKTDDPVGIEEYWHKRFESKRKSGEWFELNSSDIKTFKRRKFMWGALNLQTCHLAGWLLFSEHFNCNWSFFISSSFYCIVGETKSTRLVRPLTLSLSFVVQYNWTIMTT